MGRHEETREGTGSGEEHGGSHRCVTQDEVTEKGQEIKQWEEMESTTRRRRVKLLNKTGNRSGVG